MADDIITQITVGGTTYNINLNSSLDLDIEGVYCTGALKIGGTALSNLYDLTNHVNDTTDDVGTRTGSAASGLYRYNEMKFTGFSTEYSSQPSGNTVGKLNYIYQGGNNPVFSHNYTYSFPYYSCKLGREPSLIITSISTPTYVTIHLVRFDDTEIVLNGNNMVGRWEGISYFYFTRSGSYQPFSYLYFNSDSDVGPNAHYCGILCHRSYISSSIPEYFGFVYHNEADIPNNTTAAARKACKFYLLGDSSLSITGAS